MSLDIDIDRELSYPILRSGHVRFRNSEPPFREIDVDCSDYGPLRAYGANFVVMDSGAVGTVIPYPLAMAVGIKEPAPDEERWQLISGVGGVSVGYEPNTCVVLTVVGPSGETRDASIYPLVYVCCAPSFSATKDHIAAFRGRALWPKAITESVQVPFSLHPDGYTANVYSPKSCPIIKGRPTLQAMSGGDGLDVILIGRDWQKEHELLFQRDVLRIT